MKNEEEQYSLRIIARIHNDFSTKFGVPRQSGVIDSIVSKIIFEPEYRVPDALRGLEEYSHIWLIWQFSEAVRSSWSPTVRPPRLGGNKRMGVFATRSPFRPNAIGLSSVQLISVETDPKDGPVLYVSGADLMDGTPIFDIKPYLAYTDSHGDAPGGFTDSLKPHELEVRMDDKWIQKIPPDKRDTLIAVLSADPRPRYQSDPQRVYGMEYAGMDVRFRVLGDQLEVVEIVENDPL